MRTHRASPRRKLEDSTKAPTKARTATGAGEYGESLPVARSKTLTCKIATMIKDATSGRQPDLSRRKGASAIFTAKKVAEASSANNRSPPVAQSVVAASPNRPLHAARIAPKWNSNMTSQKSRLECRRSAGASKEEVVLDRVSTLVLIQRPQPVVLGRPWPPATPTSTGRACQR